MSTFFTSDLHFGHVNILSFCREEFANLDDMRETMILNWNNTVSDEDTVFILGDVVMGPRADNLPHLNRMNGNKILVLGNHDYPHPSNPEKVVNKWSPIYPDYFDAIFMDLKIHVNGEEVLLSHFPAEGDHTEDERHLEYRPVYDGWIIHGHLHVKEIQVADKHIHIGIDSDWTGYGLPRYHPVPIELVEEVMRS